MDDISTVDRDADVVQQMVAPGGHADALRRIQSGSVGQPKNENISTNHTSSMRVRACPTHTHSIRPCSWEGR